MLEEAPSFQGFDHATDHLHLSESPLGPETSIGGNELILTGDTHTNTADAWPCKDTHGLDSEASFLQSPISLELGPEEGPNMFASLFSVLSSFSSSSSLSRSSSTSSSSSLPVLSPDLQTQWGDDSPSPTRSPNRSSSEESAPFDLGFDDDIVYPPFRTFKSDDWHSEDVDFLSVPGGFSTVDNFEPGTSAGTIRPLVNSLVSDGISTPSDGDLSSNYGDYATPELNEADIFDEHLEDMGETVDGGDREYRSARRDEGFEARQSSNGRGNGGQDWRQVSAGGPHSNGRGSGGDDRRGGGSDDHRNDEREWGVSSAFSTPSDTESEESEEEGAGPTRPSPSGAAGNVSTSGDDDVPLARSIPTALRAQRTIRKQVRDEKDERRRQRLLRRQQRQQQQQQQQNHNQTLLDEDSPHHMQVGPAPSQGPSAHATRPRTKTLPSNSSRPIPAEDLSRRLRDIQETLAVPSLKSHSLSPSESHSHSDQLGQRSRDHARVPNVGISIQDKSLRPTRSFHRPSPVDATREQQPMPMPPITLETHRLGRSATTASRPIKQRDQPEASARARSTRRPRTSDDAHHQPSTALLHPSVFRRVSTSRTPTDISSTPLIAQAVPKEMKQVSWQQRVFVMDLQRFNTLMMNPTTTAREVIDTLEAQGQLANWAGVGGWMLFEVSQDFGMGGCHSRLTKLPYLADTVIHCRETNPAFRGCVGSHQFLE